MASENRPRGILTNSDRSFLQGEKNLKSEQSRRDARYRIRKRVRNAILDYSILSKKLSEKDLSMVFEIEDIDFSQFESPSEGLQDESVVSKLVKNQRFQQGLKDNIAFLYSGLSESDLDFIEMIEQGVKEACEKDGYAVEEVTVTIDIDRERVDIEDLMEKFENGDDLTRSELDILLKSSEFQFTESNREKLSKQFSNLAANEE
jgi:hypothetical protein